MMFRWHRSWAVGRKEITDILRDRRTVFMAVIFPLILYPLLIIGIVQATLVQESKVVQETFAIAVDGARYAPGIVEEIEKAEGLKVVEWKKGQGRFGDESAVATVIFNSEFRDNLATGGTGRIALFYDSADPKSGDAMERVTKVVDGVATYVRNIRLEKKDLKPEFVQPLALDKIDVATARQRGAFRVGQILAFLLVILCMMGALYPALDTVAGEKERGTLETLLSIPATRLEILAGKYTAVFAMSVTSVVSNFVSLSATLFMVNYLLRNQTQTDAPVDFSVPFSAFFLFLPALLPLAAFFSALTLGVASFARTTREGQYYLGPLYAAVLPLTAVALSPGVGLTYFTAFVPVLSTSLFLKEGLLRTLSWGPALVALATTCVYAVAALKWAASVFSREEVLFSSPAAEERAAPTGAARPSHALFVWAVSIVLFFFLGAALERKYGFASPWVTLVVYLVCVIGPAAVYTALWRLDWTRVFPMRPLRGRAISSTLLFLGAGMLLAMVAKAVQSFFMAAPSPLSEAVKTAAKTEKLSIWALLISMALVPAVCEELVYRGFMLRSFASRLRPAAAVALSAALFSAAHLNVYEVLPFFVLGVVLAVAAETTGGLQVPMIVHFCNNALTLLVATKRLRIPFLDRQYSGMSAVAALGIAAVAGLLLLWLAAKVAGRGGESD